MSTRKFAVVEALDNPKGAMLVRYQVVERCEPDPEEQRIAEAEAETQLSGLAPEIRQDFMTQISAARAMARPTSGSYNVEDKMVVCTTPEEVVRAIQEAKEAHEEMRRLQKTGSLLRGSYSSF